MRPPAGGGGSRCNRRRLVEPPSPAQLAGLAGSSGTSYQIPGAVNTVHDRVDDMVGSPPRAVARRGRKTLFRPERFF